MLKINLPLGSLCEVSCGLLSLPGLLGSKCGLITSEFGSVEFEGLVESGEEVGCGLDQGVEAVAVKGKKKEFFILYL